MEWYKGDIAVCIKDDPFPNYKSSPPIRSDCEYIVNETYRCKTCNQILLDIGLKSSKAGTIGSQCICGEPVPHNEIHWCSAVRFKKVMVERKVDIMLD